MISAAKRDVVFAVLLRCLTLCSAGIICLICVFVGRESWAAFDSPTDAGDRTFELAHLFTDDAWNPANRQFNLLPMIFGSLLATFGSALLAAPLGIGVAIFLNYYAPNKFGWFVRWAVGTVGVGPVDRVNQSNRTRPKLAGRNTDFDLHDHPHHHCGCRCGDPSSSTISNPCCRCTGTGQASNGVVDRVADGSIWFGFGSDPSVCSCDW